MRGVVVAGAFGAALSAFALRTSAGRFLIYRRHAAFHQRLGYYHLRATISSMPAFAIFPCSAGFLEASTYFSLIPILILKAISAGFYWQQSIKTRRGRTRRNDKNYCTQNCFFPVITEAPLYHRLRPQHFYIYASIGQYISAIPTAFDELKCHIARHTYYYFIACIGQ